MVEKAFGILVSRLRVLLGTMEQRPKVIRDIVFKCVVRGHGGRVVILSLPTSEAGVRFPAWPQLGKLVVPCCWSAVYNTEP